MTTVPRIEIDQGATGRQGRGVPRRRSAEPAVTIVWPVSRFAAGAALGVDAGRIASARLEVVVGGGAGATAALIGLDRGGVPVCRRELWSASADEVIAERDRGGLRHIEVQGRCGLRFVATLRDGSGLLYATGAGAVAALGGVGLPGGSAGVPTVGG